MFILKVIWKLIAPYLPDKLYLSLEFRYRLGYWIDWKNPKSFSEKLQWLKINDRRPEYTIMVDKYLAKKYAADKIGEKFIIPTLGVWNSADEIDFDQLPNQFVLKCNHNSGGLVICKDKSELNFIEVKEKLNKALKQNFYQMGREWPYKNVPKKIIAEKYMKDERQGNDLRDYKFYCFNGKPKYCQVISNRNTSETIDFFDMDWKHQEFTGLQIPHHPFSKINIQQPQMFSEMKQAAELLSQHIRFVRVDFYEINGVMMFGEMTFYPASGFGELKPSKWNESFGEMLDLSHS